MRRVGKNLRGIQKVSGLFSDWFNWLKD